MYSHSGKHYLLNGRWHKIAADKPAPKGAPIAAHPHAAGTQSPAKHFTDEQWAALKLPAENVNAGSHNKKVDQIKELSESGHVTGLLGLAVGSNTYGVKQAKLINYLLGLHGSPHKVTPGQKAGEHPAVQGGPAEPHPTGLPEHLAPKAEQAPKPTEEGHAEGDKWVMPLDAAIQEHKDLVHVAETPSKADDKEQLAEQKAELGKMQEAKGEGSGYAAPSAGPLQMPAFEEGKTVTGVVDYYAKVAQKIIDHGHAGNASVLEAMKEEGLKPNAKGKISNTWSGKTANSKKLLALYDAALAHATGGSAPAAESVIDQLTKIGQAKAEKQAAAIAAVEKLGYGVQKSHTKGLLLSGNKGGMAKTYANQTQAADAAQKLVDAGIDAAVIGLHPYFVSIKGVLPGAKEGDTKPAADGGTLVLKDGHWVKQGGDAPPPSPVGQVDGPLKGWGLGAKVESQPVETLKEWAASHPHDKVQAHAKATLDALHAAPAPSANAGSLSDQQLQNLQSIPWYKLKLPDTNTNAKSHNAAVAKIEAMAFAGDKAGLQAFIDAKAGAKQTYAKKQALLAQTALAGLQAPGATAAMPVEPEPAALQGPTASTPVPKDVKATLDGMAAKGDKGALQAVAANNPNNPHVAAYAQEAFEKLQTAEHAVAPGTLPSGPFSATLYHGTSYEFEKYEDEHAGKTTDSGFYGVGMSMSPYKKVAEAYAKHSSSKNSKPPIVLTKDVHLKKPLYTIQGAWTFSDAIHAAIGKKLHNSQEITDALKQAGYDGIVVYLEDGELNEVTVFSDKQVKSKPDDGPKEGETKPGANGGTLVFKDGRWRKVGWDISVASGDELSDFPDPDPSLGFATKKMLEKMAASGHVSDLQLIIANGGKEPGAVAYAKALLSKVNAEIAKVSPGQSQAMVSPPVAADAPLEGKQKAAIDSLSQDELQALQGSEELPANVAAYINKKLATSAPSKVIASAKLYSNTLDGHNKFWAVSVHGSTLKTTYGKTGTKGQETVKHFPSEAAAKAAAEKLKSEKKGKGYQFVGYTDHEHDAAIAPAAATAAAPTSGPKAISVFEANALKASIAGYSNTVYQNTLKPAAVAGDANAIKQWKAENVGKYPNTHKLADKLLEAMGADGPQEGDTKQGADGMLVLKDGHWVKVGQGQGGGGGSQYSASDVGPDGAPSMDNWVQTGGQGGSNPGGKFKDPTGQEWYCKWPSDPEAIKSEVLAAKLYALAGLSAQDCMVVTKAGKPAIATKWVDIKKAGTAAALAKVPGALEGFAVDAWLGNWDVVGLSLDNLQIGPDGKAHRVDAGGSLEYRAQGEKKPFGTKVDEIDTLRDAAKNSKAAAVFGGIKESDLIASVAKVAAISDVAIRAMVNDFGPGDAAAKKKLADTLIARKKDLIARFPKAAKPKKKATFDSSKISEPPSFLNWGGSGKSGPSSKEFLNKANEDAVQAIFAAAKTGKLEAIKDLTAPVFDKDTGKVTGHKPVLEHPSQHVKGYAQQAINEITYQLHPPKRFRFDGGHPLHSLNAVYPAHKGAISSAAAQKLGKFIVLGEPGLVKLADVGLPAKITHSEGGGTLSQKTYKDQAHAAWHKMPKTQRDAIKAYTGASYKSMNKSLWDGNPTGAAKAAAEAIHTLGHEIQPGTVLSRHIDTSKFEPGEVEKLLSSAGKVLQEPAVMSTSIRPSSWVRTIQFKLHVGPGVKGLWVGPGSQPDGGAISVNSGEDEMLLPPNTRLLILSVQKADGKDPDGFGKSGQKHVIEAIILPTN